MNLFKANRTVGEFYFFGTAFLLISIILAIGCQNVASQQQSDSSSQSTTPPPPPPDAFQSFITSGGAIITFIIGLTALGALIIGIFKKVQSNMTKEAKAIIDQYGQGAKEYFNNEKKDQDKSRQQTQESLKNAHDNLENKLVGINNNVDTKYNTTKEKIDEIKNTVNEIKKEVNNANRDNIKNGTVIIEHERRISSLETNRFHAGRPTDSMQGRS